MEEELDNKKCIMCSKIKSPKYSPKTWILQHKHLINMQNSPNKIKTNQVIIQHEMKPAYARY